MNVSNKLILCSLIAFHSTAYCAPYLSGQIGATTVTTNINTPYSSFTSDKTALLTRLAVGYMWENNASLHYGIEAGYENLHRVKQSYQQIVLEGRQYQIDTVGVIDYFFCKRWDVFAKAGVAYTKRTVSANYPAAFYSGAYDRFAPKAVVGVGYNLTNHVNLNLSLENNFKNVSPKRDLLAGIKYTF